MPQKVISERFLWLEYNPYCSVLNNSPVRLFGTSAWTLLLRPGFLLIFCLDVYCIKPGFFTKFSLDELLPGFLLNKWAPRMIFQHHAVTYFLLG